MRGEIMKLSRNTDKAPRGTASTQTMAFSHYNHISAHLPINAISDEIVSGGVKEQTSRCLKNKADLDAVNGVYTSFFKGDLSARTVIGVSTFPMEALMQLDAVVSSAEGTPPIRK